MQLKSLAVDKVHKSPLCYTMKTNKDRVTCKKQYCHIFKESWIEPWEVSRVFTSLDIFKNYNICLFNFWYWSLYHSSFQVLIYV